jgi:hypothetical protein
MTSTIFFNVTPCNLIDFHRRYRRTHCLHLQGLKVNEVNSMQDVGDKECRKHPTWLYGAISQNIRIFIAVGIQTILPCDLCSPVWSANNIVIFCIVVEVMEKFRIFYLSKKKTTTWQNSVKIQPVLYRTYLFIEIFGICLKIWLIFLPSEIIVHCFAKKLSIETI